ncbi:MAG: hypothetical protein B7Z26_01940 [Asticcacaulis sp. 32-58-5]|nr:MAG: hypothetical protein B7Z26_01940 [Asticcacaulis sp. 32-58-5]
MLFSNGRYSLEDFIDDTSRVKSVERLFGIFVEAMRHLGFDQVNFSVLRDLDLDASAHGFGLISTYPARWQEHYSNSGFARIDPVVKWANGSVRAFRWREIEERSELTRKQLHFLREGEEAGLYNGIGVPFPGPLTLRGGIALATSSRRAKQLENLDILTAYCNQFYAVYKRLAVPGIRLLPTGVSLTPSEQEVLIRLAQGLTNAEIAGRLDIKPGSVDFHVQNIFKKLEVRNRPAAATKGVLGGYIEF